MIGKGSSRAGRGYRFTFDGPSSLLRHTHAYSVDFARFLAALIQARDLTAEIEHRKGWRPLLFRLCSADGLRSRVLAPGLFDSAIGAAPVRKSLALQPGALPQAALLFKSRILLRDLLPRLEAFRKR